MPKGYFLCGCKVGKVQTPDDADADVRLAIQMQDKLVDAGGLRICPIHGRREYGWRSPTRVVTLMGGQTNEEGGRREGDKNST